MYQTPQYSPGYLQKLTESVFSVVLEVLHCSDTVLVISVSFSHFCPVLVIPSVNTPLLFVNHLNHPGPTLSVLAKTAKTSDFLAD